MNELELHVEGRHIIVNMPQTRLTVTYIRPSGTPCLVEEPLWTLDGGSTDFRARAWQAASNKARELGWID
jgi:hypothetical protein